MAYGIVFLRVIVGLTMFAHGAQKLFGWWGGPGISGVTGWLGSLRFRPALPFAQPPPGRRCFQNQGTFSRPC